MKIAHCVATAVLCFAGMSLAGGAAPEKGAKPTTATQASGGTVLIDKSSRPRKVDAAECVNQGAAACQLFVRVGAKCAITVTPEALFVRKKGTVQLVWQIETGGWSFPEADGIKFKPPGGPFDNGHRTGPQRWQVHHRAEAPSLHHYGVSVVDRTGQACTVDPVIVDDW